ncbi:MAG: DUF805 domain-containing protein [Alphaproteobacteria bacterium]|nr:MAG: DUF805 domain-containing protein [Alphaproteobacteria bacterium]
MQRFSLGWLTDYRGRVTCGPVFAYGALYGGVYSLFVWVYERSGLPGMPIAAIILNILVAIPLSALLVRRLHDQGRSGWWLLLTLPAYSLGLEKEWYRLNGDFEALLSPQPIWVNVIMVIGVLAFFGATFLPDDPETNRYGPNPRFGVPEPAT